MRRRSWIRRPVLSVPRTPPSFRRGDPGDRPNLVDDNHQGKHEVRPYNGSRRFHGSDSALRSPHPRPRGGNGAGWPASKRWPFSPKGSTAFRRSPSVRTGTPAPACISLRNTRQAGNGWGTARRARTRGGWSADGVRLATVFQPPLIPQSWGRNTNPGDTQDPGRNNPAPLLRQAPESRALLQVQNGSLGWWLGQETPGPPRSCITHCQRAEHDGMLVEHTVLWD